MYNIPQILQRGFRRRLSSMGSDKIGDTISILKCAHAVCFDVDSTVITVEGIDELANFAGKKSEVAQLTQRAMGGTMPFHEALEARLSIINPSMELFDQFLLSHPFEVTPGVVPFIQALQRKNVHVYLVSGGFTQMIYPIADRLNIPRRNVFANTILFDSKGMYSGFDRTAPTSRDGGKPNVITSLKQQHDVIVMVGDGATDMQAKPPADAFIGFGGVVVREPVKNGADWFITDFNDLLKVVNE
jgi:phosphoserine phosphatase